MGHENSKTLCPAGEALTEACFEKTPLALAKPHKHLVVMGREPDYEIDAVVVDEGGGVGWIVHPMGAADPLRGSRILVCPVREIICNS